MADKETQQISADDSAHGEATKAQRDGWHQSDHAREEIRHLLEGGPPSISPSRCGAWSQVLEALHEAHSQGGTKKVREVFNTLVRAHAELARLVASESQPAKTRWTMTELLQADFPEPPWAIPELIPVGLTVLAGRPKVGKSWLALQIAVAVGTGGRVLGKQVEKGKVLFLALEDSPRRLKNRLQKQGVHP